MPPADRGPADPSVGHPVDDPGLLLVLIELTSILDGPDAASAALGVKIETMCVNNMNAEKGMDATILLS